MGPKLTFEKISNVRLEGSKLFRRDLGILKNIL